MLGAATNDRGAHLNACTVPLLLIFTFITRNDFCTINIFIVKKTDQSKVAVARFYLQLTPLSQHKDMVLLSP